MRILAVIVILCAPLCIGCNSGKSDYDAGIAAYKRGHYSVALSNFESRAMEGDPVAQFCLGFMYNNGKGVAKNVTKAEKWYTKAAEQDYAVAQNNLAVIKYQSVDKALDSSKMEEFIHKLNDAVKSTGPEIKVGEQDSHTIMRYNLALLFAKVAKSPELKSLFKSLDSEDIDFNTAVVLLIKSASEKGFPPAQDQLATIFRDGLWGEVPDREEAIKLYREAAEQGYALAQYNLAEMMDEDLTKIITDRNLAKKINGNGVNEKMKDNIKDWYTKAAEQGYALAQYKLGGLYEDLANYATNDNEKVENQRESVKWYTKAADQGDVSAQSQLSMIYGAGWGVHENSETAVRLAFKAAQGGDAWAAYMLGGEFSGTYKKGLGGNGISQDDAESYYWYSLALKNKDTFKNTIGPAVNEPEVGWINYISESRKKVGRKLSDKEKSRIQERVDNWKPKVLKSVGTGFYIDKKHVLTNAHVARVSREKPNREWDEIRINFRLVEEKPDSVNWDVDLALLVDQSKEVDTFAKFRNNRVEVGEMIALFGYPQSYSLSYSGNGTSGQISGLVGAKYDETRPDYELFSENLFQHTAPQQGGNSGGPVFDLAGNVVGVAVSGWKEVGIENINFAIKSNVVTEFLRKNGIKPTPGDLRKRTDYLTDIYENIYEETRKFTVPVWCYENKDEDPLPLVEITINNLK